MKDSPYFFDHGGPAFPAPDLGEQDFSQRGAYSGMTLRDYFAAKAMAAHISRHPVDVGGTDYPFDETMAEWAYRQADAMLKARSQ